MLGSRHQLRTAQLTQLHTTGAWTAAGLAEQILGESSTKSRALSCLPSAELQESPVLLYGEKD